MALIKASVQVLTLFLLLHGEEDFLWLLNQVIFYISVDNPHVQDRVGALFPHIPDQKDAVLFGIYNCPWWVVG